MAWRYMDGLYGTDYGLAYAMVRGGYLEKSFEAWVNENYSAYGVFSAFEHVGRTNFGERGTSSLARETREMYATVIAENIEADVDEYDDDYGGVAVRIPDGEGDE